MFDVKDSASTGYRRIEVLTGPGRRRRWSPEDKARAVAESLVPGASPSQIARQWQICPQQLFTWRRQARAGSLVLPSALAIAIVPEPALVPILADRPLPSPPPGHEVAAAPPAPIEIEIAGAIVRAPVGLDGTALTTVLRAVRASATRV
jgi:transposase